MPAPPQPAPERVTSLLGGLGSITRRLFSRRLAQEAWVAKAGLRPPSYGVLIWIERLEPVSQKQISDRLGVDPSDLVAVVDLLEGAGFVTRSRDPHDRRRYSLTLTPLGRKQLRRFDAIAAEVEDELLAPLDDEERQAFRRLVRRVIDHQMNEDGPGGEQG